MNNTIISLSYNKNLIRYYQKLSNLPDFVLLESIDKNIGRYDILSAYSYNKFLITKENFFDIFEILEKNILISENKNCTLPFQGGAIGYISYDYAEHLLTINSYKKIDINKMPLAIIGLYDWALIVDHLLKKIILFSANYRIETKDIIKEILSRWHGPDIQNQFYMCGKCYPLITKSIYKKSFYLIKKFIKFGRCYQVNYAQPFKISYQGDPWEIYKKIRINNPVPYAAFLRIFNKDILSFSPERFLKLINKSLLTSPIKGTIERNKNPIQDEKYKYLLINSSKNRAENTMIIDLLRNDLGKISYPGTVKVIDMCKVQSFKFVHHLVSNIISKYKNQISPFQIFKSCFPGGSITGTPKIESMKIINEIESYYRGIYCGCIVYFSNHKRFDSNIAIRTLVADSEYLNLYSGGAILLDSIFEEEYKECITKILAIKKSISY